MVIQGVTNLLFFYPQSINIYQLFLIEGCNLPVTVASEFDDKDFKVDALERGSAYGSGTTIACLLVVGIVLQVIKMDGEAEFHVRISIKVVRIVFSLRNRGITVNLRR